MAVYQNENFAADEPLDVNGVKRGVPLHEGEGPNEYIGCNLINREPPAGSTVSRCNTALLKSGLNPMPGTIRCDGQAVDVVWSDTVVFGRWTPTGYVYLATPRVTSGWRLP